MRFSAGDRTTRLIVLAEMNRQREDLPGRHHQSAVARSRTSYRQYQGPSGTVLMAAAQKIWAIHATPCPMASAPIARGDGFLLFCNSPPCSTTSPNSNRSIFHFVTIRLEKFRCYCHLTHISLVFRLRALKVPCLQVLCNVEIFSLVTSERDRLSAPLPHPVHPKFSLLQLFSSRPSSPFRIGCNPP